LKQSVYSVPIFANISILFAFDLYDRILSTANAAFIHTGLTTRYRKESFKKVLSCCQARAIFCLWSR